MITWKDYYVRGKTNYGHLHCADLAQARKINDIIRGQIWERNYTVNSDGSYFATDKFIEEKD